jgi:predicted nucleic acid-binding protein
MTAERTAMGLLDTSAIIASKEGRPLKEEALPAETVLGASDVGTRDRRLATLEWVSKAVVFPIDQRVAETWAGMRAYLAASEERVKVNDLWIAATAAANRMPVITQDRDFYALSGVNGLTVVEV